ncbi:hypothetical protein BIV57_05720 [Mangrovactinospora gilvigrisea]|uniref:Uncharacterized protein n=1 Tax=Mangrovactinospora gilvigrisea TaxID=1428644 RepID=A0A1J7BY35_9ACTN|nr:hypothetical protein [Mangrovactinospora gilvigrisea]OIV38393.1 hypothetical protein BIV57_05720 [Mangrovactinospora gilvigrisea]
MDDSDELLVDLKQATELDWRAEEVDGGPDLSGGVVEILLTVVLTKTAEKSYDYLAALVKRRVEQWRSARLDPPETAVETAEVPDDPAEGRNAEE